MTDEPYRDNAEARRKQRLNNPHGNPIGKDLRSHSLGHHELDARNAQRRAHGGSVATGGVIPLGFEG